MMYALLKDGMTIKEGDEYLNPISMDWSYSIELDIGRIFHNEKNYPIRRKLSTMEEVEEFYKECE